ncbi:VOC family protein [Burkholderia territorii]|uniref:VOC family protein n=1 Tax=Burkholderia territorii TaxID=1503055 RepID=UPI0018C88B91|nr:VOC family protein [Burkholderia territorii]
MRWYVADVVIARLVTDLARAGCMSRNAFALSALAGFDNHNALSGVMFGSEGLDHRFEFTRCPSRAVESPTAEELSACHLYDRPASEAACACAAALGLSRVTSINAQRDASGRTFNDAGAAGRAVERGVTFTGTHAHTVMC